MLQEGGALDLQIFQVPVRRVSATKAAVTNMICLLSESRALLAAPWSLPNLGRT